MTDHTSDTNRAPGPFKQECDLVQDLLEAEALDILEPAEHARVQRHVQLCGACRRELADLHRVADLLPLLSEPATPSPMVKARLFQQIADESEPGPRLVSFGNPWVDGSSPTHDSPAPAPVSGGGDRPNWRSWVMSALVAPLAIALIVMAAWSSSLRNDLEVARSGEERGTVAEIAAGAGPNGMKLYSMEPSCPTCDDTPASGHLGGDPEENVGVLVAWNLNPEEKHEVWCEDRDGKLIRVSDLMVEQSGEVAQTVNFPDAIGGYTTIYVTRNDGTEEMRVALNEEIVTGGSTPVGDDPEGE